MTMSRTLRRLGAAVPLLAALAVSTPVSAQSTPQPTSTVPGPTSTVATTVPRSAVAGTVWLDLDGDGRRSAGEPSLAGVVVTVTDASLRVIGTVTTGSDGAYRVEVSPGRYAVAVTGLPDGVVNVADPDGTHDGAAFVDASATGATAHFGYRGNSTVCAAVERSGDPVAGIDVLVSGPNGVTFDLTTDATGRACSGAAFAGGWSLRPTGAAAAGVAVRNVELEPGATAVARFALGAAPGSLAFTGGEVFSLVAVGAGLVVVGLVLARRRRSAGTV